MKIDLKNSEENVTITLKNALYNWYPLRYNPKNGWGQQNKNVYEKWERI